MKRSFGVNDNWSEQIVEDVFGNGKYWRYAKLANNIISSINVLDLELLI